MDQWLSSRAPLCPVCKFDATQTDVEAGGDDAEGYPGSSNERFGLGRLLRGGWRAWRRQRRQHGLGAIAPGSNAHEQLLPAANLRVRVEAGGVTPQEAAAHSAPRAQRAQHGEYGEPSASAATPRNFPHLQRPGASSPSSEIVPEAELGSGSGAEGGSTPPPVSSPPGTT